MLQNKLEEFEVSFTFQLAVQLLQHFGVVAAREAGVSDTGHPILKLQEPHEVVDRAFTIAEMAVNEGILRGFITLKKNKVE